MQFHRRWYKMFLGSGEREHTTLRLALVVPSVKRVRQAEPEPSAAGTAHQGRQASVFKLAIGAVCSATTPSTA